jgi:hypothetical protein
MARPADRNRRIHRTRDGHALETRDGHALEGFGLNIDCVDGAPRQIPPSIFSVPPSTSAYLAQADRRVTRKIEDRFQYVNNYG